MASRSATHEAALAYARAGIAVFPCLPCGTVGANGSDRSKAPATPNGFQDASTDPARIDAWWTDNPDYNLAFSPHHAGWGIVDIDGPAGEAAWAGIVPADASDAPTHVVRTPRGGRHIYFQGEMPTSVKRLVTGAPIDTRGNGSYALLPPSRTADGAYSVECDAMVQPMPAWLAPHVQGLRRHDKALATPDVGQDTAGNLARARLYLEGLAPASEGQGADQHTLIAACTLRDLGVSADAARDLLRDHLRIEPKDERFEAFVERKVLNAYRYGQNEAGAFATPPAAEAFGAAVSNLLGPEGRDSEKRPKKRSPFWPEDETEQENRPEPAWMIPDILPDMQTTAIVGPTQSFKSFVALDMLLAIAAGVPTLGQMPVRSGPVFYAAIEGRNGISKLRRPAWKRARGVEAVPGFYVMPAPLVAVDEQVDAFADAISERLAGRHCGAIVIDTTAKAMAGLNENDARDATRFCQVLDALVEKFACPVIAVHHKGKDETRGGRGSSAFQANFDNWLEIAAHRETKCAALRVVKFKDADEPDEPIYLEGKPIARSLAFQVITAAEYRARTQPEGAFGRLKVGAALKALGAVTDTAAVTTQALAAAMTPAREGEPIEETLARQSTAAQALAKLARGALADYCLRRGRDLWWSVVPVD